MKNTLTRRLNRLEEQMTPAASTLVVVRQAGWGLALEEDRCIQILGECGYLPTTPVGVVSLLDVPDGLNAEELERFLRKHGAQTRDFRNRNEDDPQTANQD